MAAPPGALPPKVLVVDSNADGRDLIVRTLRRKFPEMILLESESAERAEELIQAHELTAIVAHRAFEYSTGPELVRVLRRATPTIPIIMTSSSDHRTAALAAGATAFLPADEWLMIGKILEECAGIPRVHSAMPFP